MFILSFILLVLASALLAIGTILIVSYIQDQTEWRYLQILVSYFILTLCWIAMIFLLANGFVHMQEEDGKDAKYFQIESLEYNQQPVYYKQK